MSTEHYSHKVKRRSKKIQSLKVNVSEWEEIGLLSFARFHDLTMAEAITMVNNPSEAFYAMVEEMKQSMLRYENFMVRIQQAEEGDEEWTRLNFLDFSE